MKRRNRVIVPLIATLALSVPLSLAQTPASEKPPVQETTAGKDGKQEARDKRIEEYLRKREERRAHKDIERQNREDQEVEASAEAEQAAKIESRQLAADAAAIEAVPEHTPAAEMSAVPTGKKNQGKKSKRQAKSAGSSALPKQLARAQQNVRMSELAMDPTVQEYLLMIDGQGASPHQLAAFGNFLAQNGMLREALEYYEVALRVEPTDPLLWINDGTLHLKASNLSAAVSSLSRALTLNPNSAVAHYNLGSALKEMNKYRDAVQEYKIALRIDPTLGDPANNPSAAQNDLLTAVKLELYQEQAGNLSMPLLDVETGRLLTGTDKSRNP